MVQKISPKAWIAVAASTALIGCGRSSERGERSSFTEVRPPVVRYEYGLPVDSFRIDTTRVGDGQTLGGLMQRAGASAAQQRYIATLRREEFDVRQLRAGKTCYAFYRDSALVHWVYCSSIKEAYVFHLADSCYVERTEKPVRTEQRKAEVVIESSLWNAMVGHGYPTSLALELSEIYAWTIDFFGLQQGDSIRVLYDEQYVDSTSIGVGRIWACDFYHGHRWQDAFYYNDSYFDSEGKSLKKSFLKAPLSYKRISSTFSYARKHPVLKVVRPHTGVDYAAPAGTPVYSIGDGVVTMKEYKGGGGNTVKIKHNSVYQTAYLHLKGFAKGLKVGQHVKQGELIGYVGNTGTSTGPHLDFRVWKNGTPVDPLHMENPPVEPVPASERVMFDSIVQNRRALLK